MNVLAGHGELALSTLLAGFIDVADADDRIISDITTNSREVVAGSCFFALLGSRHNAMRFADDAIARGAVAIVAEQAEPVSRLAVPVIRLPALRECLGLIAQRFFAAPAAAIRLFAVTGTNGKTTVAHLTAQALTMLEGACGYIGTLGAGQPGALTVLANTTPDVITLNRWLAYFRTRKITASTLEVSSHALDQGRIRDLRLYAAAFTNLGRDHLDYHGSLAEYGASKQRLFEGSFDGAAVINVDDTFGREMVRELPPQLDLWTCSSGSARGEARAGARVRAAAVTTSLDGLAFDVLVDGHKRHVESRLVGRFNVDNLLLIAALLMAAGYDSAEVCACLGHLEAVPGRMEFCGVSARGARVFVDYAHTPDALAAALRALRDLKPRQVHVVFGCGGNRDRGKRAMMGAVAARYAEHILVTSDNPRDEDEQLIADAIVAGITDHDGTRVVLDRAHAIQQGITAAGRDDIVLIAGKGHETSQEQGGVRRPFSDSVVARTACMAAST